jgi:hypothetical protein
VLTTFQRAASDLPGHWTARRHSTPEHRPAPKPSYQTQTATHKAAYLDECSMLTTPCPPFALGTEIHGDSTEADHSSSGSATASGLAAGLCRVPTTPLRNCSAWCAQAVRVDTVQGSNRRKQWASLRKTVRVVWKDSDIVRHRPIRILGVMIAVF